MSEVASQYEDRVLREADDADRLEEARRLREWWEAMETLMSKETA